MTNDIKQALLSAAELIFTQAANEVSALPYDSQYPCATLHDRLRRCAQDSANQAWRTWHAWPLHQRLSDEDKEDYMMAAAMRLIPQVEALVLKWLAQAESTGISPAVFER